MPVETGYLFGVFDLFHITHLDVMRAAAQRYDRLVVGVATDELVERTCGVRPFVPSIERVEIVAAVRAVTSVRPLDTLDVAAEAARAGATGVLLPGDGLDVVQLAAHLPAKLLELPAGRRTASNQVRTALAATTNRSSVA